MAWLTWEESQRRQATLYRNVLREATLSLSLPLTGPSQNAWP